MPRGGEDRGGVVDADDLVARRVTHQQRLVHASDAVEEALACDVVEELFGNDERPSGQRDRGRALRLDLVEAALEVVQHVRRRRRRADRDDGYSFRNLRRGRQHGGAAEAVPDQQRRRGQHLAHVVCGVDQVLHVGGKIGVGEFTLAAAKTGEVETQHGDPPRRQTLGDAGGGEDVLAAGKAVREQRQRARLRRRIEPGRQLVAG